VRLHRERGMAGGGKEGVRGGRAVDRKLGAKIRTRHPGEVPRDGRSADKTGFNAHPVTAEAEVERTCPRLKWNGSYVEKVSSVSSSSMACSWSCWLASSSACRWRASAADTSANRRFTSSCATGTRPRSAASLAAALVRLFLARLATQVTEPSAKQWLVAQTAHCAAGASHTSAGSAHRSASGRPQRKCSLRRLASCGCGCGCGRGPHSSSNSDR
jgi:hypothetical protein